MSTPDWADDLLLQVCKDEGRNPKRKPTIKWVHTTGWRYKRSSGGNYRPEDNLIRILTREGHADQKQVLLHEICHWLTRPRQTGWYGKRNWHGKRFYIKLKVLLMRYDCLTDEYRDREHRYKKGSVNYL